MKGKSPSKPASSKPKADEQPHLSGAYIRSLVKQLTSARAKDPLNSKDDQCLDGGDEARQPHAPPPPPPPPHKKQVRRRLHTSRPYQERLLNMAEARREIVTALKFHRAAMKQQQEQQQQQQQEESDQLQQMAIELEQESKSKSRRNPRIYASQMSNTYEDHNMLPYPSYDSYGYPTNNINGAYPWLLPPVAPENVNFALPNQPLGLNLNLQDFSNLESCFYQPANLSAASSSSISSSSPPLSAEVIPASETVAPVDMHHAVDDQEMAEIRSIGEKHEMEWNDTLNFVTSACWFKFLKSMEVDPQGVGNDPFDQVVELPSWLNANESGLDYNLNDYYSDDYMQDPALPGMEIEGIEGMDGEWLS